ncbi:MAG: penicillin-binding protein 1C [Saprospiraceae bacterium]
MRLARKGRPRTVFEKIVEMVWATRLELKYSKEKILSLYASNAPFGGNVVGLDAASWRYFGKRQELLSWSEAATLAVLPNSPSLIHPGRNRRRKKQKRDKLLKRLYEKGHFDKFTYGLALDEPLPGKPLPLPQLAPHLLNRAAQENFTGKRGEITRIRTTIDPVLQERVTALVDQHNRTLKANGINNLSALVIEVESGNVVAYVGNAPHAGEQNSQDVDLIKSPRSTGSILKPILYASLLEEGTLLPNSLVPDVPTQLSGYRPQNYFETYDGVVPASRAVSRSLNVPFVRMLQMYGLEKFHFKLRKLGLTSLNKPASYYGLPLVLGGADCTLWDITGIYASMARTLKHHYPNNGLYNPHDFRPPNYVFSVSEHQHQKQRLRKATNYLTSDAIWFAFKAMNELERPNSQGDWKRFNSSTQIAWKTGTSFGFKDAWAIGTSSTYAVGVWAGNADGEGRPGLIGVYAAAPLLFRIFDMLPSSKWFDQPFDAEKKLVVCKQSGFLALDICEKDTVWAPANALKSRPCPYHQIIHLDKTRQYRVTQECADVSEMVKASWFVLPPLEEFYFKSKNPAYKPLPPISPGCPNPTADANRAMQLIYPKHPTKIYVPTGLDGKPGKVVFKVAHRSPDATIYWHIDRQFAGATTTFHSLEMNPPAGIHTLTMVDNLGNRIQQRIEILIKH